MPYQFAPTSPETRRRTGQTHRGLWWRPSPSPEGSSPPPSPPPGRAARAEAARAAALVEQSQRTRPSSSQGFSTATNQASSPRAASSSLAQLPHTSRANTRIQSPSSVQIGSGSYPTSVSPSWNSSRSTARPSSTTLGSSRTRPSSRQAIPSSQREANTAESTRAWIASTAPASPVQRSRASSRIPNDSREDQSRSAQSGWSNVNSLQRDQRQPSQASYPSSYPTTAGADAGSWAPSSSLQSTGKKSDSGEASQQRRERR